MNLLMFVLKLNLIALFLLYSSSCKGEVPAAKQKKKRVRKETNGVDDMDGTLHLKPFTWI